MTIHIDFKEVEYFLFLEFLECDMRILRETKVEECKNDGTVLMFFPS